MSSGAYVVRSDQSSTVICDAGPIIHLDELGCLDLLADFQAILVPDLVWQEVARHRPGALEQLGSSASRAGVPRDGDLDLATLTRALSLDAGEEAALALMRRHPDAILLTDDAAARLVAEQLGMRVHGTIGIVVRSIRRGQRTPQATLVILDSIPRQSTLFLRPQLLDAVIDHVKAELGLA